MGEWAFSRLHGSETRRDPNEAELFKTEQAGDDEYAGNDALVREILQNAVDARRGTDPVRVRFAIHSEGDAPNPDQLRRYFGRLEPAVKKRDIAYENGIPNLPCRFLVVEDFGTRGLEGEVTRFGDPDPDHGEREDFYWFWRNIGRSGKTGEDLGRWGLGKTVYRAVSRTGCMFGLTERASNPGVRLAMGQSVLHIHEFENHEYKADGYWCAEERGEDGLPLPIVDSDELEMLATDWKLSRTNGEAGLSVVCPYVPEELDAKKLVQAVAAHFFMRVIRGELEVEIEGPNLPHTVLSRQSIRKVIDRIDWNGPARTKRHQPPPIDFAIRCENAGTQFTTDVLGESKVPSLDEDVFPNDTLHELRQKFADNELVGIEIRIAFFRKNSTKAEIGQFSVFVERSEDSQRCDAYYVREGMTITKLNAQAGRRGIKSLVLVDDDVLTEILGDTEGPAHEDWDTSSERAEKTWQRGWKGRVQFVRKIVDKFVEVLTPPSTEPDFDLLSDFFAVDQLEGSQRKRQPGQQETAPSSFEPPTPSPHWYRIRRSKGGFTVEHDPTLPVPKGGRLKVSVAYDLPRGNPLKNWSEYDFAIGDKPGQIKPTGQLVKGSVPPDAKNCIIIEPIREHFKLKLDGFDVHRDLYVRVDELEDTQDA